MKRKLGQFWNMAALRLNFESIMKPELFVPVLSVRSIAELRWDRLRKSGVEHIVFDKDNTLTSPYSLELHPTVKEAFQECRLIYPPGHLAILSNTAGSPDDPQGKQAVQLEKKFGIAVLRHQHRKPMVSQEEILDHFNQHSAQATTPKQVAIIGDRLCVDVLMANRGGFIAIRSQGLDFSPENIMVKLARSLEFILARSRLIRRRAQHQKEIAEFLLRNGVLKPRERRKRH